MTSRCWLGQVLSNLGVVGGALVAFGLAGCQGRSPLDMVGESEAAGASGAATTSSTTTTSLGGAGGVGGLGGGGVAGEGGSGGQGGVGGPQPIAALVEHDLGSVTSGQTVSFEAPAGILGMHAVVDGPVDFQTVSFNSVVAPDGTPIVENQTFPGASSPWIYSNYDIITLGIPQTDDPQASPPMAGSWQFVIGSESTAVPAHLTVWTRHTVDGLFHGGVVDVNVFLIPGLATESYVEDYLAEAFSDWGGLGLGTVTFYPLSDQYSVIDENNAYEVVQQTVVATGRPALNLMVIEYFSGVLESAAGMAYGIPGQPLEHGTIESGLVMMLLGDPYDAIVTKHESGHLTGLFHTSEIQPGQGDPLDDTPFCSDVDTLMTECPDYTNLMFPYASDVMDLLTPQQLAVLHGSAIYRGIVADGWPPAPSMASPGSASAGVPTPPPAAPSSAAGRVAVPRERESASSASWKSHVEPRIAAYLGGLWEGTLGGQPSPVDWLIGLGATRAGLRALAADTTAPAAVRMRALVGLGRLGPSARDRAWLEQLVRRSGEQRLVRIGALRALARAVPGRARELGTSLEGDPDRSLARVARYTSRH